ETSNFGGLDYTIFALDKTASDDFGYAISVFGNNIAIGARVKDSPNRDGGVAYVYAKP
ncbi:MAG: FG-GAP repeat protein, partial [Bdellovibrionaceae bacterium]|nr:FG-GAP repeat protein [Pseudobdellovibrionaceae bacterium]